MRIVTIGGSNKRVALPNGRVYSSGDTVTLTDEQFLRVKPSLLGTLVLDGGTSKTYSAVTTASTNAAVIQNAPGTLLDITISNPTGTTVYVKLYDKATTPDVGTNVPVLTLAMAANTSDTIPFPSGRRFPTGIAIAATGGAAATDTTNAVAGVQIMASYA